GAVYRPGKYEFTPGLTIKDLINKAAGVNDRAFLERGLLFSTEDGVTETATPFSVSEVLSGSKSIQLQPDDRVQIFPKYDLTESYTLSIDGAVNNPIKIPYVQNMTVEDLVLLGGGFTDGANENKIDIYRRVDDDSYETLSENFKVSANGKLTLEDGSNFILQPNDRVSVRYLKGFSEQIKVSVTGEANYPGNYTIERKNEKISDLLERAGGITQYAFIEGATLVRLNPFYKEETQRETFEGLAEKEEVTGTEDDNLKNRREFRVGINLEKIIDNEDSKHNLVLKSGDQLIIPSTKQTVKVEGEVLVPSLVRFEKGMTLKDYISKSGGFSSDAKKGKTYVVYANGDIASTKHFLFFRSYPRLEPGAAILVPAKPENKNKLSAQEVVGISTGLTTLGLLIDRLLQ
ncbi:MAG TPA: polysialic acid transporter, partial [Flavobacteriaceae bacterium]|nr:polysialic acid transporter [Flavobacteriaceae bacterium]